MRMAKVDMLGTVDLFSIFFNTALSEIGVLLGVLLRVLWGCSLSLSLPELRVTQSQSY